MKRSGTYCVRETASRYAYLALEPSGAGEVAILSRSIDLPHQDPADRFIAATAAFYDLTLVTSDDKILSSKMISLLPNI